MYDEMGQVTNENQIMKLAYGGLEWLNNMKNIRKIGFFKYEVIFVDGIDIDIVKGEIDEAMTIKSTAKLSPDQKRIKELEDALKEVMGLMKSNNGGDIEKLKLENQRLKDAMISQSNEPTINDIFIDDEQKPKRGRKPKEQ